jgi:ribosomal protein S12 methylthiotransferase
VIVGFPGETRRDFDRLVSFVESVRFENLGVFIYSDSPDLPSHRLSGKVDPAVARNRYDRIMSLQAQISLEHLRSRVGERLHVLIEEKAEENVFVGRTWFQAPEVDGETVVYTGAAGIGEFVHVKINDAMEYDLVAEPV